MRTLLLFLALLASSCAGTCSAIGGGSIGHGAIGSGAIGSGAIGGTAAADCDPFGSPDLAFMGCDIDGGNNATLAHNDPVCTWHDSGSLGVDATQATGTACPTFALGGGPNGTRDALTFDGGDRLDVTLSVAISQPAMVAAVVNASAIDATRHLVDRGTASGPRIQVALVSSAWRLYAGTALSGKTAVAGQWEAVVADVNGASSSIRVSGTAATGGAGTESTGTVIAIGGTDASTTTYQGSVGDILYYDTPPTATDVEDYLATHHASTFPVAP